MPIKTKIILSMTIIAFLAALAVLVTNTLLLSYFIDSNRLVQRADSFLIFVVIGLLVVIIFLGISIPFTLNIAKNISAPVEKMLSNANNFDALTGIYNRRYFDENLKNLINFMSRTGGKLTLMMIDIDFFKEYNDTYSYNKGDSCLKIVAKTLSKSVSRTEDFVARYGGKEFVVVLPNTDEKGAQIIAQKILSTIRECKIPHEKNEAASYVTISIGATTGKVDFSQSRDLYINQAGELLKKSIQNGHNRFTFESLG